MPEDNERPAEEVLPKIPTFIEEHETQEAATAEAERVLCVIRDAHGETGWEALCVRRQWRKGSRVVVMDKSVSLRLEEDG